MFQCIIIMLLIMCGIGSAAPLGPNYLSLAIATKNESWYTYGLLTKSFIIKFISKLKVQAKKCRVKKKYSWKKTDKKINCHDKQQRTLGEPLRLTETVLYY